MKGLILSIVLLTTLFILPSCAPIQAIAPEVNLMGLEVQDITLSHINMFADLRLYNPNATSLTVNRVNYTLFLNDVRVFKGSTAKSVTIAPEEYSNINLRISSAYWDIYQFINKLQDGEELQFQIVGDIKVGGLGILGNTFHFDKEGHLPLVRKGPPAQ